MTNADAGGDEERPARVSSATPRSGRGGEAEQRALLLGDKDLIGSSVRTPEEPYSAISTNAAMLAAHPIAHRWLGRRMESHPGLARGLRLLYFMRNFAIAKYLPAKAALALLMFAGTGDVMTAVPPLAPDVWITDRVKLSLLLDADVEARELHVDTIDGRVTLHGSVPSDAARAQAAELARGVSGVREVRNLLQVVPSAQRDSVAIGDQSVRRRVEWAVREDPRLIDSQIQVESVTKGVVVLGGRAESQSDLLRAMRRAREVEGVYRVASVIDLDAIPRSMQPIPPEDSWPSHAPDSWTTSAVKLKLMETPDVPALDIRVDTEDREVTLFGSVASAEQRQRAETAALSVAAVRNVDNRLVVVPADHQPLELTDEQIRAGVRTALSLAPGLPDAKLDVIVVDGVVELTGTAPSHVDRIRALREARAASGVRAVIDEIRVFGDAGDSVPPPQSTLPWPMRPLRATLQ